LDAAARGRHEWVLSDPACTGEETYLLPTSVSLALEFTAGIDGSRAIDFG
jgi:hypothetical protein